MNFKIFVIYLFHLYRFSFLKFHLAAILIVFFSYLIPQILIYFKLFNFELNKFIFNLTNNLSNILSGMSILMAFFVLIVQGINFNKINALFKEEIPFKSKSTTKHYYANKVIKNTIFSFILTAFLLFTLLIFLLIIRPSTFTSNITLDLTISIIILLITVYLLLGILFSMVFWSYTVTKN